MAVLLLVRARDVEVQISGLIEMWLRCRAEYIRQDLTRNSQGDDVQLTLRMEAQTSSVMPGSS